MIIVQIFRAFSHTCIRENDSTIRMISGTPDNSDNAKVGTIR